VSARDARISTSFIRPGAQRVSSTVVLRRGCVCAAIALGFLGHCRASPIRLDDQPPAADAGHSGSTAIAGTPEPSGASDPLRGAARTGASLGRRGSFSLDPDDQRLVQEQADAVASARDSLLVPIDMQGVSTQAHPARPVLPKNALPDPGSDSPAIKRFAFAARDWMHDVFPSMSGKAPDIAPPGAPTAAQDDLLLPVETPSSGVRPLPQHVERAAEIGNAGAASHRAPAALQSAEAARARLMVDSAPEYSIQRALKLSRDVIVHPLTWLAIALIGVTHIALSRGRK
jgi:hypothetical protein